MAEKKYLPGVVCWGDSLTVGAGGDGVTYPGVLAERIQALDSRLSIPVVNCGVGGETSATIATRSGAYVLHAQPFTIPAVCEPVELKFYSEIGQPVFPCIQGDGDFNPVTINGISGTITASKESVLTRTKFTFTRSEPGEECVVNRGDEITTAAAGLYRDYLNIVFIGTNGGFKNTEKLLEQQKAILARSTGLAERYLVVGIYRMSGKEENLDELLQYEQAMQEAYGEHFLNLREYLTTDALSDAGIEPTETDLERMTKGFVPTSLLVEDGLHLNAIGYQLFGDLVYEKMEALGYFDEIKNAVEAE